MNAPDSQADSTRPQVSVIVPVYNAMAYLPATVDSVLEQTLSSFEVILIDDGSSDGVQQWAQKITDPRIHYINQGRKGTSHARNTGIAQAQGEYIAFLDADDLWDPTKLEKQVACLEQNPQVGLVYTLVSLINQQNDLTGHVFANCPEGDVWEQLVVRNFIGCGSVPMVRRQCFETVGVFDEERLGSYLEDWDLWLRVARHYPFALLNESLVFYRLHPYGSSKNWRGMERSYHNLIEKALADAPSHLSPAELTALQKQSEGTIYFVLAWQAVHGQNRDYKVAEDYRRRAIASCPHLSSTKENLRLRISIALIQWFGSGTFSVVLKLFYTFRRYSWSRQD